MLQRSIFKQISVVKKARKNKKVLSELGRFPLRISIETQMFKYFQHFPFSDEKRYLISQAIYQEIELTEQSLIKNISQILDSYGLSNLFNNKVTEGTINKKDYKTKHKFFERRAKEIYIQENLLTYFEQKNEIFNQINKKYEIEKYLKLRNFSHRNAITKLKLSSNSLSST